jgi:hypothetical protein
MLMESADTDDGLNALFEWVEANMNPGTDLVDFLTHSSYAAGRARAYAELVAKDG